MLRNAIQKGLRAGLTLLVAGAYGLSQTPPSVKQEAKDSVCSNIVALSGNVSINCSSLTPAQRKLIENIPAVLNKILANQLDPDVVMAKLDEILKAVNPNLPSKTYFCNGQWRTAGPSATAALEVRMGGDDLIFQEMLRLNNENRYATLLRVCSAQIELKPEWLTPRLFCGLAYLALKDKKSAKAMLAEFESKTGPAYENADECKQMASYLRANLQ
jgi:hypothetical protein